MSRVSYSEIIEDGPAFARDNEKSAIDHSIALLEDAKSKGVNSREAIEAIWFTRRLWSVLMQDLSDPENELSDELRANIISIGIWVMRETAEIRLRKSENFQGLIDISKMLSGGLV
ncbi:MAG: flagellar biosynthesis regulator FlaF [Hyphomicrobiaceae bacterium]